MHGTKFLAQFSLIVLSLMGVELFAAGADFQGTWKGSILSKSGTSNYNLVIQINNNSQGNYVGKTEYSDLGCSGELVLVEESNDTLLFRESLVKGKNKCAANAIIKISKNTSGVLQYEWYFPNGKVGLQTTLVANHAVSNGSSSNVATHEEATQEVIHSNISVEDTAELAFRAIDETAAHPFDPQNSKGVEGVSDEALAEVPFEKIAELVEFALPYAEANTQEPRYLFALGRAALIHGDEEFARELLEKASRYGSAAADAYLAHLTEDLNETAEYLRLSINGGFAPAKDWLVEVETAIADEQRRISLAQQQKFNPNSFNRPDLINAFYSSHTAPLHEELLNNITYVSAIHNFLSNPSSVLFVAENRMIITEVDPTLSHEIEKKIMTTQRGMNQAMNAGFQSMFAPFLAIANTRKHGGSIQDEVMAMNKSIVNSPMVKLDVIRQQATQDAQRLAILYDSNPEAFRRVYAGLKKFVREI